VNRLFIELHHDSGRHHVGVIVAVRHPPCEVARRLLLLLNQTTADELLDQLRYI